MNNDLNAFETILNETYLESLNEDQARNLNELMNQLINKIWEASGLYGFMSGFDVKKKIGFFNKD